MSRSAGSLPARDGYARAILLLILRLLCVKAEGSKLRHHAVCGVPLPGPILFHSSTVRHAHVEMKEEIHTYGSEEQDVMQGHMRKHQGKAGPGAVIRVFTGGNGNSC